MPLSVKMEKPTQFSSCRKMASGVFNAKRFKYMPPDKGSFPLDHEGICKELMIKYMNCLRENNQKNTFCREEIKKYLDCRMNNELMAKEEWKKLGFSDDEVQKPVKTQT